MAFPPNVWGQLKNLTADEIIAALERDGWTRDRSSRASTLGYIKEGASRQRIVIHYHPRKTYGPGFLKGLLADIGWSLDDLRRLKLIK